jgi:hypothetical protein
MHTKFIFIRYWPGSGGLALGNILLNLAENRGWRGRGHGHNDADWSYPHRNNWNSIDRSGINSTDFDQALQDQFQWQSRYPLQIIADHSFGPIDPLFDYFDSQGAFALVDITFRTEEKRQIDLNYVLKAVIPSSKTSPVWATHREMWASVCAQWPNVYPEFKEDDPEWLAEIMSIYPNQRSPVATTRPNYFTIDYSKIMTGLTSQDIEPIVDYLELDPGRIASSLELSRQYAEDQALYNLGSNCPR